MDGGSSAADTTAQLPSSTLLSLTKQLGHLKHTGLNPCVQNGVVIYIVYPCHPAQAKDQMVLLFCGSKCGPSSHGLALVNIGQVS
jgi:hypothetical protein